MKILYHSTSYKTYLKIKSSGYILPRAKTDHCGNWFTNVQGNENLIYLCNHNPYFHALRAGIVDDCPGVILTIDTSKFNKSAFRVDENYLDFINRGTFANGNIEERKTQANQALYDNRWQESLKTIGLITYKNYIPVRFIIKVDIIETKDNPIYNEEFCGTEFHTPRERCYIMDRYLRNNKGCITVSEENLRQIKKYDLR